MVSAIHCKQVRRCATLLMLCMFFLGCNEFDECEQDSDCGPASEGWQCVRGEVGWVSSSYCAPVGTADAFDVTGDLPACGFDCAALPTGAQDARCAADGTTVCEVFCRTETHADCDGEPGNGCEVSFVDNDEHCGGCGNSCVGLNESSVAACVGTACVATECSEHWYDLNNDLDDGCELGIDLSLADELIFPSRVDGVRRGPNTTVVAHQSLSFLGVDFVADSETSAAFSVAAQLSSSATIRDVDLAVGNAGHMTVAVTSSQEHVVLGGTMEGGIEHVDTLARDNSASVSILQQTRLADLADHWEAASSTGSEHSLVRTTFENDNSCTPTNVMGVFRCRPPARSLPLSPVALAGLDVGADSADNLIATQSDDGGFTFYGTLATGTGTTNPLQGQFSGGTTPIAAEMETWTAQGDTDVGVVLRPAGANELRFYTMALSNNVVVRAEAGTRTLDDPGIVISDVVPLGADRFAVVVPGGFYVVSARPSETATPFIDTQARFGMLTTTGGFSDEILALASGATVYRLPLQFSVP